MKRAILVAVGTLAGVTSVLAYQPGSLFGTDASAAVAVAGAATASATSRTYTGDSVQTHFGPVQVEATVTDGQVTDVSTLAYPANDGRSAQINATAIPALQEQAVTAQSASIDGVSGASYTSQAFAQSLQSALVQAGLA